MANNYIEKVKLYDEILPLEEQGNYIDADVYSSTPGKGTGQMQVLDSNVEVSNAPTKDTALLNQYKMADNKATLNDYATNLQLDAKNYYGMQPKYGVAINQVQPKYGTVITDVQPAYGVPIGFLQPKYGVVTGPQFSISISQIDENIATLKKSISNLKSSWDGETKKDISTLENSWVGNDCSEYTQRLSKMDKKVQNTIAALELLCSTYEQVRNMVSENQAKSVNVIRAME